MPERADRKSLAETFFSEPNLLSWARIESRELSPAAMERLQPWLDRLLGGGDPVILPFAGEEETLWYVATETSRGFRHTREELVSLLGRTYSDFAGQPTHLDMANPVEAALANSFGRNVMRLRVPPKHREAARSRLEMFARLLDNAPQRTEELPRPAGRIVADFEEAIRQGDDAVASNCIEEFDRNGYLDAQNLLYLRIRRDEGRQHWQQILDTAQRYHLVSAPRRPRRVSQAILRAVYATTLASYEASRDADGAVKLFGDEVYPDYGALLTTRTAYHCSEADALFLMRDVCAAQSRGDLSGYLDSVDEEVQGFAWLSELIETLPAEATTNEGARLQLETASIGSTEVQRASQDPLADVRQALQSGALDEAWALVEPIDPTEASVQVMITCAWDLGTLPAAQRTLESFAALPKAVRNILEGRRSALSGLEELRKLVVPQPSTDSVGDSEVVVPQSWTEWTQALSGCPGWPQAADVAREGCIDWDPAEFKNDGSVERFAKALESLDDSGNARVLQVLPNLLDSISRCDAPSRNLSDVLETLATIHLLDDAPGKLFFETLADLCNLILCIGVTAPEYVQLLANCIDAIGTKAAAANFDGLNEVLDVLVSNSAPDQSQRMAVAGAVVNLFVRFRSRATPIQLILLRQLLREAECDLPAALAPNEVEGSERLAASPFTGLSGKTIALYSLKESVLNRVSGLLESSVSNIKVQTFHDKVGGSSALRSAARNADVFVIATAAAKHAATICIESERSASAVTLKPDGQGNSSMLRSLQAYAESLGEG